MKINIFILFCLEMIVIGLLNILTLLTIKYYTPCHAIIIPIIGRIINLIECFFVKIELNYIISMIIMVLTLIGLLVYVEIIVLNFWDIQRNTKGNIDERGQLDAHHLESDFTDENIQDININNEFEENN